MNKNRKGKMVFKSIFGVVCACLAFVSINADAALVSLDFSGALNRLSYSDCLTYKSNGSCDTWAHTSPVSSDFYNGIEFALGDSFSGSFLYDTSTSYSLSNDGYQAVYLGALSDYQLLINGSGLPSATLPLSSNGSLSIVDNRNGYDSFFVSQNFSGADWFATTYVSLLDNTGSVYNDFSIPETVDLDDFTSQAFHIAFLRRSDGDQLHLYGEINVLAVSNVPIPSAVWLFGSGLLGLIGVARRKNV